MRRYLFALASFVRPGSTSSSELNRQCAVQSADASIFRDRHTCGHLQGVDARPDYAPWTHQPHCREGMNPETGQTQEYCIFTRANSTSAKGVSLFTTKAFADELLMQSRLHVYDQVGRKNISLPYEKQDLPGRGIGVVATRQIKFGETLMKDFPALILNNEAMFHVSQDDRQQLLWRGLMQLPKKSQRQFRALATSQGGDHLEDIAHTNGVGIMIGNGRSHGAIMPELSVSAPHTVARAGSAYEVYSALITLVGQSSSFSIMVSPRPDIASAFYRFDASKMIIEVLALRDIKEGEEITISYTMTSIPTQHRKAIIKQHWGFDCKCRICSASADKIEQSDLRMMFIMEAKGNMDKGDMEPLLALELAVEILHLYEQEGLVTPKAEFCMIAAKAADALEDFETAERYAHEATYYWKVLAGEESEEVKNAERFLVELKERQTLQGVHAS